MVSFKSFRYYWIRWNTPESEAVHAKAGTVSVRLFKGVCRIDALIDTPSCKVLVFSTFYRVRELDKVETVYHTDGSRQGAEIPPPYRKRGGISASLYRLTFLTLQPVQQGTILSNSCPRSLSTRSTVKLQKTLHSLKLTS